MPAYYNEIDPFAAQWLRNLIGAGHIAPGYVDERDIRDVKPADLRNYTQCHFFAGIAVWSYALRRAGWPDDRPVWTGSCPCQPFSAAGAGAGFDDKRHLWPHFHWLIQECSPADVFGEQVASKDAEPWVNLVQADLEKLGYTFGAVPFPSAGVGAPHIRDRLFWMGHAHRARLEGRRGMSKRADQCLVGADGLASRLGHADSIGTGRHSGAVCVPVDRLNREYGSNDVDAPGANGGLAHGHGLGAARDAGRSGAEQNAESRGTDGGLANSDGRKQRSGSSAGTGNDDVPGRRDETPAALAGLRGDLQPGPVNGFWRDADWLFCRDGKWRPVMPGSFPLAHGLAPGMGKLSARARGLAELAGLDAKSLKRAKAYRSGTLRGYGNAINAEAAVQFIAAAMESITAI